MGLRFDPVGGGQFKQAVKQIMEAESQPLKQLEARKAREEAKLKLFQEFKGKFGTIDKAIAEIATFKKLRELKVDLGDGSTIANVTVDKEKAQPGSYQISVDELAARTSVISNGFESADDPVMGLGFIVMNLGNGDSAEVFVDQNSSSLTGIANLINAESSSPVRAAVIKDATDLDNPFRLILTAKKDGAGNAVEFPEFYFMDGSADFYVDSENSARNALVTIDGFQVELESNDLADFLPGVAMHLKQARPEQPFTLTITEDFQKIGGKVKGLVDQLNGVLQFINKQNQVDQSTDTKSTFAGDSGLQMIEFRLRNLMHEGFPVYNADGNARVVFLGEMGIEFDKGGSIVFKEDKFNKHVEKDFEGVAEALSGEFGLAFQLKEVIAGYTRAGNGLLNLREQTLRGRITAIDRQIDTKVKQLDKRQQALTDQFSRLQGTLANMQRQQQYLSATLPSGGGGNLVQQLLGG